MSFDQDDHLINPALLRMTKQASSITLGGFRKQAFIPGGDPSMGGGGGDPAAGGGAPPGGDPMAGGGGAPPPDAGGGGGGAPPSDPRIDQLMQQMQQLQQGMGGGGMGGGAGGPGKNALTPKIDEKAVMLQILKIQARIADQLGVKIPASEMVVNQTDMQGLAQASTAGGPMPGMDPSVGGGGAGGAGGGGAIGGMPPMDPMQGAGQPGAAGPEKAGSYRPNGTAFDTGGLSDMGNKAAAIRRLRAARN